MRYRLLRKSKGSLVHAEGYCLDCGKEFTSRNALAVAARHTDSTGHTTSVDTGYHTRFFVGEEKDVPKDQSTVF